MGAIMALSHKNFCYEPNLDPFFLLSENNLLQLIVLTSAAYFTISTELRLEEQSKERNGVN